MVIGTIELVPQEGIGPDDVLVFEQYLNEMITKLLFANQQIVVHVHLSLQQDDGQASVLAAGSAP